MINYGANYIGVDRDRYDAGNKFYSQDRFLQGTGLDKPAITFNPSRSNTGIMSAYNPYPIIPQYDGGGDGGGPINPGGPDYGYTGPGSTGSPEGFNIDDIGEGTIDDEDMPTGPNLSLMDMIRAGGAFMLTGPLGAANSLRRSNNRNRQEEIDKINADINAQYGTPSAESGSIDYGDSGYEGMTDAQSDQERSEGGRGSRMAYGGRVGYSNGGLSKYEIFKLGELGYNTKGGTILEPFGGIKVLRDILKVNKYAGGGIVGLYR